MAELGLAVLERAGGDEYIEGVLRGAVGAILQKEGKFEDALAWHRRSLELYERSVPHDRKRAARAGEGIAFALNGLGRIGE